MHNYQIVSRRQTSFLDRSDAARRLAQELKTYAESKPVVFGIPRGGVLIAAEIARELKGDLDIVLTHKIGYPGQSEAAVASVTESGKVFTESFRPLTAEDRDYLSSEKKRQLELLSGRAATYREVLPKVPLDGRVAIVTDDGAATGLTLRAALWAARQENPKTLIAAIPVAPSETVEMLAEHADFTLCFLAPPLFFSVHQFYLHFDQLEDEDVLKILKEKDKKTPLTGPVLKRTR